MWKHASASFAAALLTFSMASVAVGAPTVATAPQPLSTYCGQRTYEFQYLDTRGGMVVFLTQSGCFNFTQAWTTGGPTVQGFLSFHLDGHGAYNTSGTETWWANGHYVLNTQAYAYVYPRVHLTPAGYWSCSPGYWAGNSNAYCFST